MCTAWQKRWQRTQYVDAYRKVIVPKRDVIAPTVGEHSTTDGDSAKELGRIIEWCELQWRRIAVKSDAKLCCRWSVADYVERYHDVFPQLNSELIALQESNLVPCTIYVQHYTS